MRPKQGHKNSREEDDMNDNLHYITMNKKQNYIAPEVELIKLRMETGLLYESTMGSQSGTTVESADYNENVAW